jgi:ABC-type molybdate transport system permease subunit
MTFEVEVWMFVATIAIAVIPWAMSIHAKVAVIATAVESLPEVVQELKQVLEEHEDRLEDHAKKIQALQAATKTSD